MIIKNKKRHTDPSEPYYTKTTLKSRSFEKFNFMEMRTLKKTSTSYLT